ncbi:MAG: aminofutalosine synthase MqnE, partial [Verrucomicrobiota bacterium]
MSKHSEVLEEISNKVFAEERISENEALWLYRYADLHELGKLANFLRERKNGNVATYIVNRYLNYSNICILN